MSEQPIQSGTYTPNQDVNLTVWNEGDTPPEGYDVIQTSDGSRLAVMRDRGDVKRDAEGNAYAIPEGGALAQYADGTVNTLIGDDLDQFVKDYRQQGGNNTTPTTSGDSAGAAADAAAASPVTTTTTPNVTAVPDNGPVSPVDAGATVPSDTASATTTATDGETTGPVADGATTGTVGDTGGGVA